jgi:hypothetical protein
MLQTLNTRSPALVPALELVDRVVESPVGKWISGFHVHSLDDTLEEMYTESVIGSHLGRIVRRRSGANCKALKGRSAGKPS